MFGLVEVSEGYLVMKVFEAGILVIVVKGREVGLVWYIRG